MNVFPAEVRSLKEPLHDVVLVDMSWKLHQCWHAYNLSSNIGGLEVPTGDIYGIVKTIQAISTRKPNATIIFCLDSKNPFRKDIDSSYKSNRDTDKPMYQKFNEVVATVSLFPHVFVSAVERMEADDVIYSLAGDFSEKGYQVWIHANDRDLYQAFQFKGVRIFKKMAGPKKFDDYGEEIIEKKFGHRIPPEKLPFFRSLSGGDSSDAMYAYPRFPKDLALMIVTSCSDPEDLLGSDPDDPTLDLTPARRNWIKRVFDQPNIMRNVYRLSKLERIKCPILKAEGSWNPVQKYQMKGTISTIKRFIDEGDGGNRPSLEERTI